MQWPQATAKGHSGAPPTAVESLNLRRYTAASRRKGHMRMVIAARGSAQPLSPERPRPTRIATPPWRLQILGRRGM